MTYLQQVFKAPYHPEQSSPTHVHEINAAQHIAKLGLYLFQGPQIGQQTRPL